MSCITKNAYQWSVKSVANYTDRVENVQSFTGMWREYIKPQSEKWREKKKQQLYVDMEWDLNSRKWSIWSKL